jgi:multidrug efflux pump subunit AcrA (membrane-fusion protein)
MTARATLTYRRAAVLGGRILVPVAAVFQQPSGGQVVWVVGAEGRVAARPVRVGQATGGQLGILEGLEPGERIAVAGVSSLREGMQVRDLGTALGDGPS